jgi:hypothetical protein
MSARLLTPAEVRETLGERAAGKSDDELLDIAERIRLVSTVLREELAAHRPSARK